MLHRVRGIHWDGKELHHPPHDGSGGEDGGGDGASDGAVPDVRRRSPGSGSGLGGHRGLGGQVLRQCQHISSHKTNTDLVLSVLIGCHYRTR